MLVGIKLLHTIVWALIGGCVLYIPVAALSRRLRLATILSVVVWLECAVLGLNGGRCPLTDVAARYTADRAPNFDIYLPVWLAQYNKTIFGAIFVISQIVLLTVWMRGRMAPVAHK